MAADIPVYLHRLPSTLAACDGCLVAQVQGVFGYRLECDSDHPIDSAAVAKLMADAIALLEEELTWLAWSEPANEAAK